MAGGELTSGCYYWDNDDNRDLSHHVDFKWQITILNQ